MGASGRCNGTRCQEEEEAGEEADDASRFPLFSAEEAGEGEGEGEEEEEGLEDEGGEEEK